MYVPLHVNVNAVLGLSELPPEPLIDVGAVKYTLRLPEFADVRALALIVCAPPSDWMAVEELSFTAAHENVVGLAVMDAYVLTVAERLKFAVAQLLPGVHAVTVAPAGADSIVGTAVAASANATANMPKRLII
jgi:hypothetical protein